MYFQAQYPVHKYLLYRREIFSSVIYLPAYQNELHDVSHKACYEKNERYLLLIL